MVEVISASSVTEEDATRELFKDHASDDCFAVKSEISLRCCACMCVCIFMCVCVCVCCVVLMHICVCMYLHVCVCVSMHLYICTCILVAGEYDH
jgi:hypothetical protein